MSVKHRPALAVYAKNDASYSYHGTRTTPMSASSFALELTVIAPTSYYSELLIVTTNSTTKLQTQREINGGRKTEYLK
jgi:hypothetical protein